MKKRDLEYVFTSGKHAGKSVKQVIDEGHGDYIHWLDDNDRGRFFPHVFIYIAEN